MNILLLILLISISVIQISAQSIKSQGGVTLRPTINKNLKNKVHSDFKALVERRLKDKTAKPLQKSFLIKKNEEYKKAKFMGVVASILKEAKQKKMRIRSIKLGRNIRSIFENQNVSKIMNEMINDPNFLKNYHKELELNKKHQQEKLKLQKLMKKTKRQKRYFNKIRKKCKGSNF